MRCKFLWSFAVAAAAWTGLAGQLAAADESRQPDAALGSSGEIRVKESAAAATPGKDAAQPDAAAKPKAAVPTPAKRKPAAGLTPADADASKLVPIPTVEPAAAEPAVPGPRPNRGPPMRAGPKLPRGPKPAAEPLRPIPDPQDGPPVAVETASFKGVVPGRVHPRRRGESLGQAQG